MIIKPSINDYKELIRVWEDSVRATHNFITEEDIQFYKPLILNEYFKVVNLLCNKDEKLKINGFMGIVEDKLEMLFIDSVDFCKGIGKKLLIHAITEYKVKKVDVNEQNEQAVGFYKHMGFIVVKRSEVDPWGKNFPILFMELIRDK